MSQTTVFIGTGRRKTAVARVRVSPGTGQIKVNSRLFEVYFPQEAHRGMVLQPFIATATLNKFDVRVLVNGGGPAGQACATRHGLARALLKADLSFRPLLKVEGLLTRDPRMRERKKYGQPGARKRFQFSKR